MHCLLIPSLSILGAGALSTYLGNELIHYMILFLAIPISALALVSGTLNHKTWRVLTFGVSGLSLLMGAVLFGDAIAGETGELFLTIFGSVLVIYAHIRNQQICREIDCLCHDEQSTSAR
ncbi:MAG: Uncharacterised protein [Hyphomonas sp. TMED17]|nr:MAG: Uncharacterised protein [Hyphomonas sp. TMED17]